ncbi:MAG: fumarylacetoacetate hydrolase [Calothrix sp. SM1_5_4]|nr:fumarylacetoacetate hydrolase [Calothrix sp. SM1_5_4]
MDKLICVGKNYLNHARELGDAIPESPLYFLKPPSTIFAVRSTTDVVFWPAHGDLHHEIELVLKVARQGEEWVFSHYTVGLDMTLRDIQSELKKSGQPWEKAKVFTNSTVLGHWRPLTSLNELLEQPLTLKINGQLRQRGHGRDMRFKPDEILRDIQRCSRCGRRCLVHRHSRRRRTGRRWRSPAAGTGDASLRIPLPQGRARAGLSVPGSTRTIGR